MNEQEIPLNGFEDGRRVAIYVVYKTDTFLSYRLLNEKEEMVNRDAEEDWYFQFNHLAPDKEVRQDFKTFIKRFRPKNLKNGNRRPSSKVLKEL
jgi:hypothetical protein